MGTSSAMLKSGREPLKDFNQRRNLIRLGFESSRRSERLLPVSCLPIPESPKRGSLWHPFV